MAWNRYLDEPAPLSFDQRCTRCRQGVDRIGRYCRRCLKTQRLKLFFGTVAVAQITVAGLMVLQSSNPAHAVPLAVTRSDVQAKNQRTGWLYYDVTDQLIDDVTHHARLMGNNPSPPPGAPPTLGAVRGTLDVSYSRHYGSVVMVSFPTVTKACGANPCEVRAMFDNLPPRVVPFEDASDKTGSVLILGEKPSFMASLKGAHDLTIVASLGTGQDTIMTFRVDGFAMSLAARGGVARWASTGASGRHG